MPPLVLFQTHRFLSSENTLSPAVSNSPMWRQSMHRKAIAPSLQALGAFPRVSVRKPANAVEDISPTPMANSRWRVRPSPHT